MTIEARLRALADRFADDSAEAACKALGDILAGEDLAREWLAERLEAAAQAQPHLPAGYADAVCRSLVMLDHHRVHLSLAMISADRWQAQRVECDGQPDIIGFADGWTAIRFLKAPDARVQHYVLGQAGGVRRAVACRPAPIASGQMITIDNARQALRFDSVGADVVMLRLLVRDADTVQAVECDARSGEILRLRDAQSHHGRTRMMLSLLRSLGRSDFIASAGEAMTEWPAHLRWHLVREALAADTMAGYSLLAAVADADPDEDVAALARRTRADLARRFPQLAA